ncbi:SDR family oxidoreductase [Agromyces ramosus]|uniref:Oxidoreductase n=1 Tax=Agromyces ramosus TaxID=33879 RepID=A0ABU0R8W2_9MICO|nr:SDR family NAD(P)-dependent oxidoreductase [Agromyces ramosus]MDQ0893499.1 putative oxidoreductase [Agromyces ramosus]
MQISGNTIFIPGATSGIGLALALRLQDARNTVIIGGRRTDVLDRLAAEHGFDTVTIDVSDPAPVLSARDAVLAAHPDLNVLIAMAGIMVAEDVTTAGFLDTAERTIDTNVLGPVRLVAAFIEHLQTRPDATIMTVSSGLAHTPRRMTPSYNASKAFIHQFSESIRLQLAGTSVQVIELVPPAVRTELMPGGSQIESFLPLEDYIDETMSLLASQPDATEILVERVKPLRFSEVNGTYAQAIAMVNAH